MSSGLPLIVLFFGYPLWWALGLGEAAFIVAAAAMGLHLWHRRRTIRAPRGFGIWLFFLLTVLVSSLVLPARAPGTVGDGNVLTYLYRVAWYLAVTIALLYVGNLDPRTQRSRRILEALGFMFVVTVAGGLAGMLVPEWEAQSLVERLLPKALSSNEFVQSLVHLDAADQQDVLGYEEFRPKAPFAFANAWGANFAAFLPFFLYTWLVRTPVWRRVAALAILVAGLTVAVATLNRALWLTLAVGGVYAGVQAIRLFGRRGLLAVYAAAAIALVLLAMSGLPATVAERVAHPHSNDRRSELALRTVEAVALGSPLIGFGNTRDVEGSFASIGGGSTAECADCGVPPMGTQGHLWLVLFSQGVVGVVAFASFVLYRMARHRAARDPRTVFLLACPLFLLLQAPFYDLLGPPLFAVMAALGFMWAGPAELPAGLRSATQARSLPSPTGRSDDSIPVTALWHLGVRRAPVVAAVGVLGMALGVVVAMLAPRDQVASVDVLVPAAPVFIAVDGSTVRTMSLDTEAQRALSDQVMSAITSSTGDREPRDDARVRAYSLTRVLRMSYSNPDGSLALEGATAMAREYVRLRAVALQDRLDHTMQGLDSAEVEETAALGLSQAGSSARQRWAITLANHEQRRAVARRSIPPSAEIVSIPEQATSRGSVEAYGANGAVLGTLLGFVMVGMWANRRREGG